MTSMIRIEGDNKGPDLLVVVFTMLDRLSHYHWGEPVVLDWYRKMDQVHPGKVSRRFRT